MYIYIYDKMIQIDKMKRIIDYTNGRHLVVPSEFMNK